MGLLHFLLGNVFCLWILILLVAAVVSPLVWAFRTWRRSRRYVEAQARALENPQNAEARYGLAEIYLAGRRRAKAERYAREAVEVARSSPLYDPMPYRFPALLGRVLYARRRYAEAAEAFEQALKAKSETGYYDALLGLAKSHYRLGRVEAALEWAGHAVRENESALEGYFRWAQIAAAGGRKDQVAEARERFVRTRRSLPRFARQRKVWFTVAFWLFPISRRIG